MRRRRRRVRPRRLLAGLVLLAVLVGLLELNRFLPGTWPGGGGEGGSRRRPDVGESARRVRPPEGEVPDWPREGVTIVLRGPGAEGPAGARVGVDLPGAGTRPVDAQGRAVLDDPRVLERGLLVRTADAELRHGPVDPELAPTWTVHFPDALPPAPPRPETVRVEVVAAEDGRPLPGAEVTVRGGARLGPLRTDAEGVLEIPPLVTRALLVARAEGRREVRAWASPHETERVRLALAPEPTLGARFVDAEDGSPVAVQRLRVRSPEGDVLWQGRPGPALRSEDVAPGADLGGALLEVWSETHPVVQVPLAEVGDVVRLPRGRGFEVAVRDEQAQPLPGAGLRAHYVPEVLGAAGLREPLPVEVPAGDAVVLPAAGPARVLVEANHSSPRALDVETPADGDARVVALAPGVTLGVHVLDQRGRPLLGARVVARASVDGLPVRRETRSDRDGRARVEGLPRGPVEVYAHTPGRAWAALARDLAVDPARVVLVLVPGHPLRLVVETRAGLPLAGVRVHAAPAAPGETRDVVPPDARPARTGPDGTIVLDDLPDRPYRVRLSLPGYADLVLEDVRPGPGAHFVTLLPR